MLWFDGELSGERNEAVGNHIESCPQCGVFVENQRRMETLWRNSFRYPDEAAFDAMRKKLVPAVPWWRKQRTWLAAAAVFSVYLGVKVFYLDHAGRPMAEIAVEAEESFFRESLPDGSSGAEQAVFGAETLQEELVHDVEVIESEEDLIDLCVPMEEPEDRPEVLLSVTAAGVFEEDDGTAGGLAGLSGESVQMEEACGDETLSPAALQAIPRDETRAAGGGGVAFPSNADRAMASCEQEQTDSVHQEAQSTVEAKSMVLTAVLEAGETINLRREDWEELFLFADSVYEGEILFLNVDSLGRVTGSAVSGEKVLPVPDDSYRNCSITVTSF